VIKIVFTDIDGVWTDGGMYYSDSGIESKRFSTYDGAGVAMLHHAGIEVGILSGEDTPLLANRAKKLKVDHLVMGAADKLDSALRICAPLGIDLSEEAAYIGDDFNDLNLLRAVKISAAPGNAHPIVKANVGHVLKCSGGGGAFREFVEEIVLGPEAVDRYVREVFRFKPNR
jgi:3-deoxy-D-glycero-D-galacto-nononate 9-phosphatase